MLSRGAGELKSLGGGGLQCTSETKYHGGARDTQDKRVPYHTTPCHIAARHTTATTKATTTAAEEGLCAPSREAIGSIFLKKETRGGQVKRGKYGKERWGWGGVVVSPRSSRERMRRNV